MIRRILTILAVMFFCLGFVGHVAALSQQDIDAINGNWVHWQPDNGEGNCGTGSSVTLTGSDNAEKAFNYFVGQGLTPFQSAGIIGNMEAESGVLPQRLQGTPPNVLTPANQAEGSKLGWGIVQWTPAGKMITPTKQVGKDPNDIGVQLDFVWTQISPGGNEAGAGNAVKSATSVEAAAIAFLTKYERPADPAGTQPIRISFAQQILAQYGNGAPSSSGAAGTGCDANSPGGGSISGYKDPFRDIPKSGDAMLRPNRIDQGVDYDGAGPVYAIGNGTVNGVFYNFYAGLPYIAYTLSDGPATGKTVYFSECISVPDSVKTPGTKVTPDTVIANMNASMSSSCHSGTEIGWANASSLPDPMAHSVYHEGHATAYGLNFSQLLQKLGSPPGIYQYPADQGHELGTLEAGWPNW